MTAKCKLLLLLSLLFTAPLMADTVSLEEAQEKALQFISQKNIDTESGKHLIPLRSRDLNLAQQVMTQKDQPAYYIFNIGENGYVIVAGDDFATPILGYSNETYYDENNIPDGMKALLENYESQVSFVSSQSQKKQRWLNANWKEINPLIKTQWDQSSPYNSLCPVDPVEGIHTLTGCVPTAMAQLLYYYHWPEYGTGRVSYQWKGQTLSANLSKTLFEWDKMKLSYQYNEEDEGNAVSTLMYSCALAAGADFGIDATCASCGTETLSKYFGYKDQIKELDLDNTSIDDFEAVVYHELTNSRPVLFSSDENGEIGHLMIIDGFKDGLFHINFGWGGWGDGYFPLTAILTDWYFFNTYQSILYDIQPDYDAPAKTNLYPSSSYLLSEDGTELIKWTGLESEINMNEDNEFSMVTKIKSHAFSNNTTVYHIVFPSTVDTIEAKALEDCKQLESVFIPQSVSHIAPQAFYNCPFLDHFVVREQSSSYISKNGTLIDLRNNVVVASASGLTGSHIIPNGVVGISNYAFAGRDISSLEISRTVVRIEEGAFQDCNQLSIVKIPEDLQLIGRKAFSDCTGLKQIVVLATTPPQVREGAFNGVDCSSVYLCVPAESLDLYLHSPGWEQFTTVIGVSQPAAMKLVVYMKDGTFESFMLSEMPIIKNTDDELIVSTSSSTQSFKVDRIQRIQYFEEADDPTPHEEDEPYAVFDNGVLTFYYDILIKTRNGEKYKLNTGDNSPGWLGAGGVSKVVFDSSFANTRPTTTYEWFKGFSSLTSFEGMEYLNTSEVINMANMYEGCNSLSTLDVSHFSTAKVTDMSRMFYGCSALTSLNVGNFNTANCTNMEEMFMNDYQLTSLDLSHFDMSKCTQTKGMMKNCSALKSLSLSSTMGRLAEDACEGVGSPQDRCDIIAPEGFDFGVDTSNGYFKWKSGFFRLGNTPFALSSYEKTMKYGETEKVQLIGGHGDYTISNSQPEVVTVLLDEEVLVITAIGAGRATISVTDNKVQQIVTLNVIVTRQSTIEVEPRSISFGNMTLGTTKSEHFTVYNTGEGILTFHIDYSTLGGIFNVLEGNQEYILGPEESKQFTIVCSISDDYEYYGGGIAIYVRSDATNEVSVMVSVSVSVSHEKHIPAEAIDLGLPSGTKWASYNVGATKPEEIGSKYAWGETETKNTFRWSNYIHCDGTKDSCHDIGNDISGTEYDVARAKWGNEWQMPTYTQYKELLDCCSLEPGTKNGVNGCKIIGPNGQSIFMPYTDDGVFTATYWSASLNYIGKAYFMALCGMEGDFNPHMVSYPQYTGCCIRPVISTDLSNINYEVLNFNELPKHSNIKIYDTSGKMIKNERTGENPQALNLHDLEKGVYLVNVNGVTYKIVRK